MTGAILVGGKVFVRGLMVFGQDVQMILFWMRFPNDVDVVFDKGPIMVWICVEEKKGTERKQHLEGLLYLWILE